MIRAHLPPLARNSDANRGDREDREDDRTNRTIRTIGHFVRNHHRGPKVLTVLQYLSSFSAPILALNCKLNPVQTRHTHKKGAAPFRKQPTDTNNLNFTLLIFTPIFTSLLIYSSQFYILLTLLFFRQPHSFCGFVFLFLLQIYGEKNNLANQKYLSQYNQNLYQPSNAIRLYDMYSYFEYILNGFDH